MRTFFICTQATACWEIIGIDSLLRNIVQMVDNITVVLFDLLDKLPEQQRLTTAKTLWSLWKSRNLKLWESIVTTLATIISRAHDVHHEWTCMLKVKFTQPNSDNNSIIGYCMFFRYSLGQVLLGKSNFCYCS